MRSCRESPLVSPPEDLLAALRASGLLPAETVESLAAGHDGRDPRAWASELVERGLLTGYQAEQLLAGNGRSLLLGQYRILGALGAGGMGRVYRAEHVVMRRLVALKVVGPADDGEPQPAFLREIEAAARLSHPNVVAAYDAGEANGVRFLVMEYVDGVDLDRLVRTVGPLAPRRACEYARQAALALQYAFENGVLHRDVKPANLLLESAADPRSPGRVKVLDLGLAVTTGGGERAADAASRLSGTPDYIAPEVAHNPDGRDVRSDLYSLGCTLYYLLTGQVPFPGGTWTEKLLRHEYEAPAPLRDLAPAVPPAVAALVARLMAKAPADRHDTPAAVARALEEWLALGDDPPAAPAPVRATEPAGPSASPDAILDPGPPSVWDITLPEPAPPARRRTRLSWLLVLAGALVGGLAGAWWVRGYLLAQEPAPAAPPPPFLVASSSVGHATLEAAVAAAAADGDTITISGDGPFTIAPLSVTGKALTLRAAPGARPSLRRRGPSVAWQSLLASDRPLALEGIELRQDTAGAPSHLVYVSGGSLRLSNCRVAAPHQSAPVVARGVALVELRDCQLVAGRLALCVEATSGAPCQLVLSGNTIAVEDADAAAVSVWAADRRVGPVSIDLEGNEMHGARILSLRELAGGATVTRRNNRFVFGEALLCVDGRPAEVP
jgi:serine/threonine-protein kinase